MTAKLTNALWFVIIGIALPVFLFFWHLPDLRTENHETEEGQK